VIEQFRLQISCTDPFTCSERILSDLGNGPGFKLRAEHPSDSVHGSISILHLDGNHILTVELYDIEDPPTESRSTHLLPLVGKPTRQMLAARLNASADPFPSKPVEPARGLLARAWDTVTSWFTA
jgi:hypothetical protein